MFPLVINKFQRRSFFVFSYFFCICVKMILDHSEDLLPLEQCPHHSGYRAIADGSQVVTPQTYTHVCTAFFSLGYATRSLTLRRIMRNDSSQPPLDLSISQYSVLRYPPDLPKTHKRFVTITIESNIGCIFLFTVSTVLSMSLLFTTGDLL